MTRRKRPLASVVTRSTTPVSVLSTSTSAAAIGAPVVARTVPISLASVPCAAAMEGRVVTAATQNRRRLRLAEISFRIDFSPKGRLGPGKAELLERVAQTGSIAQAAKAMDMSYRKAWLLIDSINRLTASPSVETTHGGKRGGGARLTETGHELLRHYAAMERAIRKATAPQRRALERLRS